MGLFVYAFKRFIFSIPIVVLISILCFGIIQLPPGDYADAYAALASSTGGGTVSKEYIAPLTKLGNKYFFSISSCICLGLVFDNNQVEYDFDKTLKSLTVSFSLPFEVTIRIFVFVFLITDPTQKANWPFKPKKSDVGILVCGSGTGMSISANKFKGIRCALCHNNYTAKMARNHNNANVNKKCKYVISFVT